MDMNFETVPSVTVEQYIRMIELKTAALLGGSLQMGAITAKTSIDNIQLVDQIGRNLGIAFQLQDDYLDTFGDPQKFGKKIGGDILQNKKTFLMLSALEMAGEKLSNTNFSNPEEKIKYFTSIFEEYGIKDLTQQMMKKYKEESIKDIQKLTCSNQGKAMLIELSEILMGRET
jgi:geranylgeranyl diphosphate synthase type II